MFARKYFFRVLGIPVIEDYKPVSDQPDEIFRQSLEQLEERRQKMEVNLQHLQSRHEYLAAVVKAGPYALISLSVALAWAFVTSEWGTTIPLLVITMLVVLLAIGFNRLDSEANNTIGDTRLNYARVKERFEVREMEVKTAIKKAQSKAPDIFKDYFQISFDRQSLNGTKKQIQNMLPDAGSQTFINMNYRHPKSFAITSRLCDATRGFIAGIESWRGDVERKVKQVTNETGPSNLDQEERINVISRSLLYCLTENLLKKSHVKSLQEQGKIEQGRARDLMGIFDSPYNSLLNDKDLKAKSIEIEKLRKTCVELKEELNTEVSVLYGQG